MRILKEFCFFMTTMCVFTDLSSLIILFLTFHYFFMKWKNSEFSISIFSTTYILSTLKSIAVCSAEVEWGSQAIHDSAWGAATDIRGFMNVAE